MSLYALICLDRPTGSFSKELTYSVPSELSGTVQVGSYVLVPLVREQVPAFVVGFTEQLEIDAAKVRPILSVLSPTPLFHDKLLHLSRWVSNYYHAPLMDALRCLLPPGLRQKVENRFVWNEGQDAEGVLKLLERHAPAQAAVAKVIAASSKPVTADKIRDAVGKQDISDALRKLVDDGFVVETDDLTPPLVKPQRVRVVTLNLDKSPTEEDIISLEKKSPKQAAALRALQKAGQPLPAAKLTDSATLRSLTKKGWVTVSEIETTRVPEPDLVFAQDKVELTPEQEDALNLITQSLESSQSETLLIHGVTASGKTEVYLRAIERTLALGRQAIVLVPEIALTAQTVGLFRGRFGARVAVLHSALSQGERFDEWRRARAGQADIVVGPRSAAFAPLNNVGLIVVDEEHDGSYKQEHLPHYHARDVARRRAEIEKATLVLGSATPSLESYYKAQSGGCRLAVLSNRVGERPMPTVEIVDMTQEAVMGQLPILSGRLRQALLDCVNNGEQAILFLNRRGFAPYVQCLQCGFVERCPNCDVALTYHLTGRVLRCHHCDHAAPAPTLCAECQGTMMQFVGVGTEKVEAEVLQFLPSSVNVMRMDRDTTMRKGSHGRLLRDFREGKASVLIGTQMIAKGLDFPSVTLVGVILADIALNLPDFRAAERTFQLLAQVSGRAGRGDKPGAVLIQTLSPTHYAIQAAQTQNFVAFYNEEIEYRREFPYPPLSYLVNVIVSDPSQQEAQKKIQKIHLLLDSAVSQLGGGTTILGPVPCPLSRLKGDYRFHLLVRDANRPRLHRVLQHSIDALPSQDRQGVVVDVDPVSVL
jgi:primosomal protein N' (replication factor Y)